MGEKKAFNWELTYNFGELVHDHHGGKHAGMSLEQ